MTDQKNPEVLGEVIDKMDEERDAVKKESRDQRFALLQDIQSGLTGESLLA